MPFNYHKDGTLPTNREVFVFGSNLLGAHCGGAAREAQNTFGATPGIGFGRVNSTYAIPTIGHKLKDTLTLGQIKFFVDIFLDYAREGSSTQFFVTRIGCGIAKYRDIDIAPLFQDAPQNCSFAEEWKPYLEHCPSRYATNVLDQPRIVVERELDRLQDTIRIYQQALEQLPSHQVAVNALKAAELRSQK